LHQCLVVSPSRQRAKWLERAAGEQGWETIIASDAEDAAREAVRNRIQLAVVDLQSVGTPDEGLYRELVEQLATGMTDGPLLIVCGAEEDAMGEIWSRQLGVWMYLPGVDDQSDVAMLCGEARNVVEKLHGSTVPAAR
jgi:ActR/RegA family two-component response regulator